MFPIRDSVPSRSVPVVTRALILINALVFFFELALPENMLYLMRLYPQPTRRHPSVEYVPLPYRSGRPGPPAGD